MAREAARWLRWYRSWELQQEHFIPNREARFSTMLDLLAASLPPRFTALDLGSGPGALSARLLRRFPRARCVAVDFDPVVLRVGQGSLGDLGGRLSWVDADLRRPGWERGLPFRRFDAALSTTALHWLDARTLGRVYRVVGQRLRRGGVFVNGDRMPWGDDAPVLARLAKRVHKVRSPVRRGAGGRDAWRAWWSAAYRDRELGPLFAERERRQSQHPRHDDVPLSVHLRGLRRAGFSTTAVVWRDLDNAILFARR